MDLTLGCERAVGRTVIGVDEAGRGPLAGGVFAAAVTVPFDRAAELLSGEWRTVNDSKRLSPARRETLAAAIKAAPGCVWAVAQATSAEVDGLNILNATHLAMRRAVEQVLAQLPEDRRREARVLVDGLPVKGMPVPSANLVKGDAKSPFVAAASILAKTARDADCLRLEKRYPGWGFAVHKGYPTAAHLEALNRLGPCPEHRRSFAPVARVMSRS